MLANQTGVLSPKFVIYGRVSPDLQGHRTCDAQIEVCKIYLKKQNRDADLFEIITDEASSAGHRPGFEKVCELVKAKQLATLIVASIDRLGRTDNVLTIIRDVIFSGGEVIVVQEGISTTDPDWDLRVRVAAMSHSHFTAVVAERVRQAQSLRFITGEEGGQTSAPAV